MRQDHLPVCHICRERPRAERDYAASAPRATIGEGLAVRGEEVPSGPRSSSGCAGSAYASEPARTSVDHAECRHTDAEQRCRAASAGSSVFQTPPTRRAPRSRRPSQLATDTATQPLLTATSGSRRSDAQPGLTDLRSSWRRRSGSATTATTRRCTASRRAPKLRVDQIDLLILHQALPSEFEATLEAYRALETLLADGKVRAIGVSNFMVEHLTTLLERTTVVPAVNQIEVHPYFAQGTCRSSTPSTAS